MDKLDLRITETRGKVDDLDRKIAELQARRQKLEIELGALEEAAALRPISVAPMEMVTPTRTTLRRRRSGGTLRTGRQPGSISTEWRHVLAAMYAKDNSWLTYEQIRAVAADTGLRLQINSVRDRVRRYRKTGLIEASRGKFRVSHEAINRFGFTEREGPPGGSSITEVHHKENTGPLEAARLPH